MTRTLKNVRDDVKARITVKEMFDRTDMAELAKSGNGWRGWFKLYESDSRNGLVVWDRSWYDHSSKCHGDVIDVMGYSIDGTNWRNTSEQYITALQKCAELTNVEWVHVTEEAKKAAQDKRQLYTLLTSIAEFYHGQLTPARRQFLHNRYGLKDETIDNLKLGWATPDWANLVNFLKSRQLTEAQILSTGLASKTKKGGLIDFYRGRLVFPYWAGGRVVYSIARRTDETPQWIDPNTGKDRASKYIKQHVHSRNARFVSKHIDNSRFYYEDVAHGAKTLYLTEGVTDCILANQEGFPCVSPVTIHFKKSDWPRLLRLTRGVQSLYLAFDNEENEAGERGALDTARHLWQHGKDPFLVSIPRPPGVEKIDLNDFLREKGADEFRALLHQAKNLIDITIDTIAALPQRQQAPQIDATLIPLLADIYDTSGFSASCKIIKSRLGQGISNTTRLVKTYRGDQAARQNENRIKKILDDNGLPSIGTNDRHLPTLTGQAWRAIHKSNQGEPSLFRWANAICRVELSDYGTPILRPLSLDRMRHALSRLANWHKLNRDGDMVSVYPPDVIIKDVLATPDPTLPTLHGVTGSPVFAADGTLQIIEGYNEQSKLYYNPTPGFSVRDVPVEPTEDDVNKARGMILSDVLSQFPFAGPNDGKSELAHAVAMFLQPFVRPMIAGPTPMYLIEKPTPGTGATLMVQAIVYAFLGGIVPATTEGRSEEEWRKRITAKLGDAPAILFIDNLRKRLDSSALASVITSQLWEDRILGVSEMTTIQARCMWISTGNNPSVSSEIKRRCVRIRLDARCPDPHLRGGFKHPRLLDWVRENRSELAWSALILIQNWIAKDQPRSTMTLGMFDDWAQVMGGILETSNVPGFLGNLKDFYQKADLGADNWIGFISAWWQAFGGEPTKTQDLIDIADEIGVELGEGIGRAVKLGKRISGCRDRQYEAEIQGGTMRVQLEWGGMDRNYVLWKLSPRDSYGPADELLPMEEEVAPLGDWIHD